MASNHQRARKVKADREQQAAEPAVCLDCVRSKEAEARASQGGLGCDALYKLVDACMANNRGQVSACNTEWTQFRACRKEQGLKGSRSAGAALVLVLAALAVLVVIREDEE